LCLPLVESYRNLSVALPKSGRFSKVDKGMDPSDATFIVEHDDASAGLRKHYVLSYWTIDGSVAMYDSHAKRQFLKRVVPPEKPPFDAFFLGGTVVVCSRPLKVVDYADETTRKKYAAVRGNALLLVKPDAYYHLGKIISMVYNAGLGVGQLRMLRLTGEEAATLYAISGADKRGDSSSYLTTENTTALEIVGDDVISRLHTLAGPANPADATEVAPASIR
jgi:nucleoside diphosphate kinase